MKISQISVAAAMVASASAQFSFPKCGTNTIVQGIAGSGCSFTDAQCLCKAETFIEAAKNKIGKKCKTQADLDIFINFINTVCAGQKGYPLVVKASSAPTSMQQPGLWSTLAVAVLAALNV